MSNYLNAKMLNDVENKVLELHKKFVKKFGLDKIKKLTGPTVSFNHNYEKAIIKSLKIQGKSEQATYTGKNLVDFSKPSSIPSAIKYSFEKDVMTLNQVGAGAHTNVKFDITNLIKNNAGKSIKFRYESINVSEFNSTSSLICNLQIIDNGVTTYPNIASKNGDLFDYTIPEDTNNITLAHIRFLTNNSSTLVDNSKLVINKPMLLFTTSNDTPYESYVGQPSPNPEYPQEIKTVKGVRSLFDKDNPKILKGYINSGKLVADENSYLAYISCEPNTTYTISKIVSSRFIIYGSIDEPKIGGSGVVYNSTTGDKITITTNATTNYLMVMYYKPNADTLSEQEILDSIMIEKGSIAHDYVPYGTWLPIKDTGKNIYYGTSNSYSFTPSTTNWYYINGSGHAYGSEISKNTIYKAFVKKGKTYTISTKVENSLVNQLVDSSEKIIKFNGENNIPTSDLENGVSFTATKDDYVILRLRVETGKNCVVSNVQLEQSPTATEYEPYKETTTLIDMNKPNLFDKDNTTDGYLYIIEKNANASWCYQETQLKENETYCLSGGRSIIAFYNNDTFKYNLDITNTTFKVPSDTNRVIINCLIDNKTNIKICEGYDDYYELPSVNDTKDILTIKDKLAKINQRIGKIESYNGEKITTDYISTTGKLSTGATVYYILAEPQIITLNGAYDIELFEGTNNITVNDELEPNMDVNINCLNTVDTELRNIKIGDRLSDKILFLNFPWESYENITNTKLKKIIIVDNENDIQYEKNTNNSRRWIAYRYEQDKTNYILYSKYDSEINNGFNYIRYKLPKGMGIVTSINNTDIFYPYIKIKDNEYKLLKYNKKTWIDNEIPYLQYIDNIEEGINNVAKIFYIPNEYESKEWTTTGYYGIGVNDYGLAQKPISEKDFERWNKNIELLESAFDSFFNIWNIISYINWNEESQFEWEEI